MRQVTFDLTAEGYFDIIGVRIKKMRHWELSSSNKWKSKDKRHLVLEGCRKRQMIRQLKASTVDLEECFLTFERSGSTLHEIGWKNGDIYKQNLFTSMIL